MSIQYQELFKPFKIGRVEVKNRVCMSAMHPEGWMDEHGILTDTAIRYYEERAKGGTGLIFTGALQPVTQFEGAGFVNSPFAAPGKFISQYRKLADRLHAYGSKVFIQIAYGGGRVTFPGGLSGSPIAASEGANRWDEKIHHRMLTTEEVKRIIKDTIDAVRICRMTGCDGVDINAYGGYLFDEFLTDAFNHRTDEFGGSLEAKLKILTDIITAVKKEDHFLPHWEGKKRQKTDGMRCFLPITWRGRKKIQDILPGRKSRLRRISTVPACLTMIPPARHR